MHAQVSYNTIFPTKVLLHDPYSMEIIKDYMRLRPDAKTDVLLIVGDSTGVLEDLARWYDIAEGIITYHTMCLNYSVMVMPKTHKIEHYAAGDAHMSDMQRVADNLPDSVTKHAWNPGCRNFDVRWVRNGRGGWNGTSANLAIKIALALDYTRIVLSGCPMDNTGNWYSNVVAENDVKKSKDHRHHLWKWCEIATRPIGKFVRSMSGNTRDLFGEPTREWLNHLPETGEKQWQKTN